jgi:mRNA interferase YafQ
MKYRLVYSKRYERSFKRILKSGVSDNMLRKLRELLFTLASGKVMPANARDHALTGDMSGYREFHVGGDMLVVYTKHENTLMLELVNIGSNAQIFE